MASSKSFGRSSAALVALAAGSVVVAAVMDARRKSVAEPKTAEAPVTQQVQDAPVPLEPPAKAVEAPAIAVTTVAPAPPQPVEARQPDTDALVEDVQELRDQIARLKQDLGQARADSQTTVLLDMDRHLAGIRTQIAENQVEREEKSEAAQQAAPQRHQAVQTLFAAQRRLLFGDSHVLDNLDAAAPALPYPAQAALVNARDRIESEDLYAARYWIGVAIAESGWSELVK